MNFVWNALQTDHFWINVLSIVMGGFFTIFALTNSYCALQTFGWVVTFAYLVVLTMTYGDKK